jgi:hypothetical protein
MGLMEGSVMTRVFEITGEAQQASKAKARGSVRHGAGKQVVDPESKEMTKCPGLRGSKEIALSYHAQMPLRVGRAGTTNQDQERRQEQGERAAALTGL